MERFYVFTSEREKKPTHIELKDIEWKGRIVCWTVPLTSANRNTKNHDIINCKWISFEFRLKLHHLPLSLLLSLSISLFSQQKILFKFNASNFFRYFMNSHFVAAVIKALATLCTSQKCIWITKVSLNRHFRNGWKSSKMHAISCLAKLAAVRTAALSLVID